MDLERYEYVTGPRPRQYEFFSEGPKGRIRKLVKFSFRVSFGIPYYNLAFGDWREHSSKMDDTLISNNGDTQRIFATVAAIVVEFTDAYPDVLVCGIVNSPSRNRLYQMNLNKFRGMIEPYLKFLVKGRMVYGRSLKQIQIILVFWLNGNPQVINKKS